MPRRKIPLVTESYYHVYNRGVNKQPIFFDEGDYQEMEELCYYYRFARPLIRYSDLKKHSPKVRAQILRSLEEKSAYRVHLLSYVLMPNHFHLLFQQIEDGGIATSAGDFQNAFTKYINTKHDRTGHLFQGPFKVVEVETDEQLLHLSRYIHLNPSSAGLVNDWSELERYPWSSLPAYLNPKRPSFCQRNLILSFFGRSNSGYRRFVQNHLDYQRNLAAIKHLVLEA